MRRAAETGSTYTLKKLFILSDRNSVNCQISIAIISLNDRHDGNRFY